MNRWDKRRQIERAREAGSDVARVVTLRDNMAADLRRLQGRLEGIEMAIAILGEPDPPDPEEQPA